MAVLEEEKVGAIREYTVPPASLPADNLRTAIPHLRRPFAPEAVKFKVQTVFSNCSGCLIVAYIDARLATERLNHVCPDLWYATYEPTTNPNLLLCKLTVDGITREDVGEASKGLSKDLYSDALKRAAVHFGVGVSVYALPQIPLFMRGDERRIEKFTSRGKDSLRLTPYGHEKLREGYAKWLEEHGIKAFGTPLAHGDVEGAVFDEDPPEDETPAESVAPVVVPLTDEKAVALVELAKAGYADVDKRKLPPALFNQRLAGASGSHKHLEEFIQWLAEEAKK